MILSVSNLSKHFRGLKAVKKISFDINNREVIGLIGPNGAGKTTVFNLITGLLKPERGSSIVFLNEDITNMKSYKIARKGIARTFQKIQLFSNLSVLENIKIGAQIYNESSLFSTILNGNAFKKNERIIDEYAKKILCIFNLYNQKDLLASGLPYGTQRIVEIVRAVATKPKILLLDEPVAGMNAEESSSLSILIKSLVKEFDISVLLVEHDMSFVMGLCNRIIVMNYGEKIAEGTPIEVKTNSAVIEAYLGGGNTFC